jgi:hypothetical protein
MTNPASDWIDAFPEEPSPPSRPLPPARVRTRRLPATPDAAVTAAAETAALPSEPAPEPDTQSAPAAGTSDEPRYEIGYCKPPTQTRFQPGRSGNPRGRPKGSKSLNTLVQETLSAKVTVRTGEGTKKISRIEAVLQKTLEQAMKGNGRAQTFLISLWRNAVPETPEELFENGATEQDLTSADLAILEAYKATLNESKGEAA